MKKISAEKRAKGREKFKFLSSINEKDETIEKPLKNSFFIRKFLSYSPTDHDSKVNVATQTGDIFAVIDHTSR